MGQLDSASTGFNTLIFHLQCVHRWDLWYGHCISGILLLRLPSVLNRFLLEEKRVVIAQRRRSLGPGWSKQDQGFAKNTRQRVLLDFILDHYCRSNLSNNDLRRHCVHFQNSASSWTQHWNSLGDLVRQSIFDLHPWACLLQNSLQLQTSLRNACPGRMRYLGLAFRSFLEWRRSGNWTCINWESSRIGKDSSMGCSLRFIRNAMCLHIFRRCDQVQRRNLEIGP